MYIFVIMNYLRKFRNRFITKLELVSALDAGSFLISPPNGFTTQDIPVEYNGIYFTLSSASLNQESKSTSSGTVYTTQLKLSFPTFPGIGSFQWRFSKLSEIRLTLNTGAIIRLNRNDIALNKPIDGLFTNNVMTVDFEATLATVKPFDIDE